jgi:hypothetical protein
MLKSQIVTVSFFRYQGRANCWWGFKQMGLAPTRLAGIPGLQFYKMVGSGNGNGFSIWPNFGVYGLIGVWDEEKNARDFFAQHELMAEFRTHTTEIWTVYLQSFKVHGNWDQQVPFEITTEFNEDLPIAVLTRATIRASRLWHFWSYVPRVSKAMWAEHQSGLLFSVGIGELPLIQQATFSLWTNSKEMQAYAYKSPFHSNVIRKTRELGWYKEELFARFHPFDSEGTWGGQEKLQFLHPQTP